MLRSKQSPPQEAAAAMAAGVALHAIRRRARLPRVAIWTLIAASPIAPGLSLTSATASTAVAAATPDPPTATVRTTAVAADPSGYAQLFVNAWLRSSADDASSAQARLAQSMAPSIELPDPAADAQPAQSSVTAVRSVQSAQGAWSVTVAAQYADGRVRYYAVAVAADRAGTSFTVTGAPGVGGGRYGSGAAEFSAGTAARLHGASAHQGTRQASQSHGWPDSVSHRAYGLVRTAVNRDD